ncbi:AMP-binding protein [Streptomyces sp. M19]
MRALSDALGVGGDDRGVSWLPLHHDMGLIGKVFVPLFHQAATWYMPPTRFIRDPVGFLRVMSDVRGTVSFAPNFAYGLMAAEATDSGTRGLDLSSWRIAGAAPSPYSPKR